MTCPPPPVPPPVVMTSAQILAELRHAYHVLLTGNQRATVRYKERESSYAKTDLNLLRQEIRRYEIIVAAELGQTSRSVAVGPSRCNPFRRFHPFV